MQDARSFDEVLLQNYLQEDRLLSWISRALWVVMVILLILSSIFFAFVFTQPNPFSSFDRLGERFQEIESEYRIQTILLDLISLWLLVVSAVLVIQVITFLAYRRMWNRIVQPALTKRLMKTDKDRSLYLAVTEQQTSVARVSQARWLITLISPLLFLLLGGMQGLPRYLLLSGSLAGVSVWIGRVVLAPNMVATPRFVERQRILNTLEAVAGMLLLALVLGSLMVWVLLAEGALRAGVQPLYRESFEATSDKIRGAAESEDQADQLITSLRPSTLDSEWPELHEISSRIEELLLVPAAFFSVNGVFNGLVLAQTARRTHGEVLLTSAIFATLATTTLLVIADLLAFSLGLAALVAASLSLVIPLAESALLRRVKNRLA